MVRNQEPSSTHRGLRSMDQILPQSPPKEPPRYHFWSGSGSLRIVRLQVSIFWSVVVAVPGHQLRGLAHRLYVWLAFCTPYETIPWSHCPNPLPRVSNDSILKWPDPLPMLHLNCKVHFFFFQWQGLNSTSLAGCWGFGHAPFPMHTPPVAELHGPKVLLVQRLKTT